MMILTPLSSFGEVKRIRIQKGQKAPFTGHLFTDKATVELQAKILQDRKEFELKLEMSQKETSVKLETQKLRCDILIDAEQHKSKLERELARFKLAETEVEKDKQIYLLSEKLSKISDPPFWETTEFSGAMGFIIGAGATVLIVLAVRR